MKYIKLRYFTIQILLLISCGVQKQNDFIFYSNDCLELKMPKNWQVDASSNASDYFTVVLSNPRDSFENKINLDFYTIKSKEETLEVIFRRLLKNDPAIDSTIRSSTYSTNNLGKGFYAVSKLTMEKQRLRKGFFFKKGTSVIIINGECLSEEMPEHEVVFDKIVESVLIKCF